MSMAEIVWSSVCIPAVMASCRNNLCANSLPPRETAIVGCLQDHLGFGISCCLWQSSAWIQLYYTWSQVESRSCSDIFQCPGCACLLWHQSAKRMVRGKWCWGFLVPQKHMLRIFKVLAGLVGPPVLYGNESFSSVAPCAPSRLVMNRASPGLILKLR